VLLHLYQPIEPGLEELGKARPNGGVIYPGANEVSIYFILFYFLRHKRSLEDS
jgi:hypothetical protein